MSECPETTFTLVPVGYVRLSEQGAALEILEPYRPALKQLEHFGHVHVFWWAHETDYEEARGVLQSEPWYAPGRITGMFACRSPARPNPVCLTTTEIIDVDEENGLVILTYIDAEDGTPVVDLKPYIPVSDRVREIRVPEWLDHWPEWQPTEEWEPTPKPG